MIVNRIQTVKPTTSNAIIKTSNSISDAITNFDDAFIVVEPSQENIVVETKKEQTDPFQLFKMTAHTMRRRYMNLTSLNHGNQKNFIILNHMNQYIIL